jgi:hypothetical protein
MTPDQIRALLYPDVKPSNPHRSGAIVYNAYDRNLPLRYEVQREASRMNGREIADQHFILFDLHWRIRIRYDRNERPVWLAMRSHNAAYRREMAMFDEPPTGLPQALLAAQEGLRAASGTAGLLGSAQVALSEDATLPRAVLECFHADIDLALKRHLRPLLAERAAQVRAARERLLDHARRKPKLWETPLDTPPALGFRWRTEGDLLAVVATRLPEDIPVPVVAYVTRRRPYKPYRATGTAVPLAAERAAEIARILADDSNAGIIGRGRLLDAGDDFLSQKYLHPYMDRGRTERDIRRAIAGRMERAAKFARVDLSEEMMLEAIDYVVARSRERDVPAAVATPGGGAGWPIS